MSKLKSFSELSSQKKKETEIKMTDGVLIPKKNDNHLINSWKITFYGSILLLSLLVLIFPKPYMTILKVVAQGIPVTFQVTISAIIGATLIGLLCGLGAASKRRIINMISGVYVEVIRGIPLLVQLIFIYYALGRIFSIQGIAAAIVALAICFGAYLGEIFRAGIQAVPKGQMEAALSLGMTRGQAFKEVILPQTVKIIIPAIGNEFISMLKDSSLVSAIALSDILRRGQEYIARTFQSLETMLVIALVYLIITLLLSRLVGMLEERMHNNG